MPFDHPGPYSEAGPPEELVNPELNRESEEDLDLRRKLESFLIEPGTEGKERKVIANILPDIDTRKQQMIVAPVGSGKTLAVPIEVLLGGKEKARPDRVIVVQPTQQLTANAADILRTLYGEDLVGHWYGGMDTARKRNQDAKILVVTGGIAWNMFKRGEIKPNDYVFEDEVHQSMGFDQTEVRLAALTSQYESGKRQFGVGMATGTFPTQTENGRQFLDFTQSDLLETGEKNRWKRELLPGGYETTSAVRNYLSDESNNGRNLLVLVPTNRKVSEMVNMLGNWAETSGDGQSTRSREGKNPAQPFRAVFFSKDIGAGAFNQEINGYLRDRAAARKKGAEFNERLVIVATYGSAGSGVNYPVEDAIGDATYIQAINEDEQTKQLIESPVTGNILAQAFGRIGRHADGRFYLVGYSGNIPQEEMLKPDPLPTPLKSSKGMQAAVFGLIEAGVNPREVTNWYSRPSLEMRREIEKTYAFLASRGLLKEGRVTEIASRISRNPLSDQNLDYALAVEAAPDDIRGGLQEILATADSASWRSLFVKEFMSDNKAASKKSITDLLLEKKLLRKGEDGNLFMPDSDEPLPDSDTAVILNVARYLSTIEFSAQGRGNSQETRKLSLGEISNKFNLSYKALERLFTSIKLANTYNKKSGRTTPRYFTNSNWESYLRAVIESNNSILLEAGYGSRSNHNIMSDGVYCDAFVERSASSKISSELVACLSVTEAKGATAKAATVFTGSVLGKIPPDLVEWLPENLEKRIPQVMDAFKRLRYAKPEEREEFAQQYPQVIEYVQQCMHVEKQTADYAKRAKAEGLPTFDPDKWNKEFLLPHMMLQRVDNLESLNKLFANLAEAGVSLAPDLHNFVSAKKIEQVDREYPAAINLEGTDLPIKYDSYYNAPPIIEVPETAVPVTDGRFQIERYPLTKQNLPDLERFLTATTIMPVVKIKMGGWGGSEFTLPQLEEMPPEKFTKIIDTLSLKQMVAQREKALGRKEIEASEIDKKTLFDLLGRVKLEKIAVIDKRCTGIVQCVNHAQINKGTFNESKYVDAYYMGCTEVTADRDPFETQYNHSDKNYFVKNIEKMTFEAYQEELANVMQRMQEFVAGFDSGQVKSLFEDTYNSYEYKPRGSFSSLIWGFAYRESKRFVDAATAPVEDENIDLTPLQFDTEQYQGKINEYFSNLNKRIDSLNGVRERLYQLNELGASYETRPQQVYTLLQKAIKSAYAGSEEEFAGCINELSDYADYAHKCYIRYIKTKEAAPGDYLPFTQWLANKESALMSAEKIAGAVPMYLGDGWGTIYAVYNKESHDWGQYVLNGFSLNSRKGTCSRYRGSTPKELAQSLNNNFALGAKGEGLSALNLDGDDVEALAARGIKVSLSQTAEGKPEIEVLEIKDDVPIVEVPTVMAQAFTKTEIQQPVTEEDITGRVVEEEQRIPAGPSRNELNRSVWTELESQGTENPDLILTLARDPKPAQVRHAELATVLSLTAMPYSQLERIGDLNQSFPHLEGARKRMANMLKEIQHRTKAGNPVELDTQILERSRRLDLLEAALTIAKKLIPDWIGENKDLQDRAFAIFLRLLSEESTKNPEVANTLGNYGSAKDQNQVPESIASIFIQCAEQLN